MYIIFVFLRKRKSFWAEIPSLVTRHPIIGTIDYTTTRVRTPSFLLGSVQCSITCDSHVNSGPWCFTHWHCHFKACRMTMLPLFLDCLYYSMIDDAWQTILHWSWILVSLCDSLFLTIHHNFQRTKAYVGFTSRGDSACLDLRLSDDNTCFKTHR